jgi:hypothetical protein
MLFDAAARTDAMPLSAELSVGVSGDRPELAGRQSAVSAAEGNLCLIR